VAAIADHARERGLAIHLDGARIWNAAVAAETTVAALCSPFDTVSVCFSKGLGAPVGSALCGDEATIQRAVRFRKMLGGGMRQAGILGAAALYALEHHRERIAEDHAAARRIGEALSGIAGVSVVPPETNIVNVDLPVDAAKVVEEAKRAEVLFNAIGPRRVRLVTHLDVSGDGFDAGLAALVGAVETAVS
jgi:threonine aldolase